MQHVHTALGIALAKLAGTSDIQVVRKIQDNLSSRLEITPISSLHDLYEVIDASVKAVK